MSNRDRKPIAKDYRVEFVEYAEGGFFARIPDLPHCIAEGRTLPETLRRLEENKRAWIEAQREQGRQVPGPTEIVQEYSGRFLLRLPKSLHRWLAEEAEIEGVSLNQFVVHLLAERVARRQTEASLKASWEDFAKVIKRIAEHAQPSFLQTWWAWSLPPIGYRAFASALNWSGRPSERTVAFTVSTKTPALPGHEVQEEQNRRLVGVPEMAARSLEPEAGTGAPVA